MPIARNPQTSRESSVLIRCCLLITFSPRLPASLPPWPRSKSAPICEICGYCYSSCAVIPSPDLIHLIAAPHSITSNQPKTSKSSRIFPLDQMSSHLITHLRTAVFRTRNQECNSYHAKTQRGLWPQRIQPARKRRSHAKTQRRKEFSLGAQLWTQVAVSNRRFPPLLGVLCALLCVFAALREILLSFRTWLQSIQVHNLRGTQRSQRLVVQRGRLEHLFPLINTNLALTAKSD
jgi:hypothetical protein